MCLYFYTAGFFLRYYQSGWCHRVLAPFSILIAEDKGDEPVVLVIATDNPPSQLVVVVLLGGR